jgi:hypothetical protein
VTARAANRFTDTTSGYREPLKQTAAVDTHVCGYYATLPDQHCVSPSAIPEVT